MGWGVIAMFRSKMTSMIDQVVRGSLGFKRWLSVFFFFFLTQLPFT